jgi:hypothetical protein
MAGLFSWQTPNAATDVDQQSGIAQDLKLLADFIPHMPVVGMQFLQFAGVGVNILIREFFPIL